VCFYHDDDGWHAEVYEAGVETATSDRKCQECRGQIPAGERYYHLYAQQHEQCVTCGGNPDDEDFRDDTECTCAEPDFGETMTYDCCLDCRRVLEAIQASEEEAGCRDEETRPALWQLRQAMRDEGERYAARALLLYPDLGPHLAVLMGPSKP
jgi:hypothetical protein